METRNAWDAATGPGASIIAAGLLALTAPGCTPTTAAEDGASAVVRAATTPASSFTLFESGQVRPLALSPDRSLLFAVNTPDNHLEVFRINGKRLIHTASITVG